MSSKRALLLPRGSRELHVVDVENLVGGPADDILRITATARAFSRVADGHGQVLVTVGTSHGEGLITSSHAWPHARYVWEAGHDGADHALLKVLVEEDVAARFHRVVIGSGDGAFAPMAAHLQMQGVRVTVVGRRGAVSRRTRLAVRDVRYIEWADLGPHPLGSAA